MVYTNFAVIKILVYKFVTTHIQAVIAQLGERQTEDLKVPGSIPGRGIIYILRARG